MVTVPVTIGFDQTRVIGQLVIDESQLPPTPGFVFSLGIRVNEYEIGPARSIPRSENITSFELVQLGLISEESYLGYLKQIGKA